MSASEPSITLVKETVPVEPSFTGPPLVTVASGTALGTLRVVAAEVVVSLPSETRKRTLNVAGPSLIPSASRAARFSVGLAPVASP